MEFDTNMDAQNLTGSTTMQFENVAEQPAKIKVIGVGGGGGNAVNHMYRQGIKGVDFIVCNTDAKALNSSPVPNRIVLGTLGAGNIPERARKAALEHKDEIREAISTDTQMLFITAGMGGGTGTGAAPVIAEIAKSIELDDEEVPRILVVAIVTMPFSFEGPKRKAQALKGIEELKKHVDSILVINNDKLRSLGNMSLIQAFSKADDVLLIAAKGIAEIITVEAYVSTDFRDVNTVMEKSGTALMGAGEGRGEGRALAAIESATTSVFLDDNDIRGAKNILLNFTFSPQNQITMDELWEVTEYIRQLTGDSDTNVIWGAGDDDSLDDELKITFIATGFKQKEPPQVITLEEAKPAVKPEVKENAAPAPVKNETVVMAEGGISMTHKNDESAAHEQESVSSAASPFESNNSTGERRLFVLDQSFEDDVEEAESVEAVVIQPEAQMSRNSYLDDIRVLPKAMTSQNTSNVQTVQTPSAPTDTVPVFAPEKVAPAAEPVNEVSHQAVEQQVTHVFNPDPMMEDPKVMARAERIRRINELLHNDPDGPRAVESFTTEQLTSEPIFETQHSSVKDAGRTTMSADGIMMRSRNPFEELPD